jgi:hypothetical protein
VSFTLELPGAGMTVAVTFHALERYGERVRPHEERPAKLHEDMVRLAGVCGVTSSELPLWARGWDQELGDDVERCYVHCGDVCLVVKRSPEGSRLPGAVVTVLAKGHMGELARAHRNGRRAGRTWARVHEKKRKVPRRHVSSRKPILEE